VDDVVVGERLGGGRPRDDQAREGGERPERAKPSRFIRATVRN